MTYRVIIQPRAEVEISQAYEWIAAESPRHALRWLNDVQRAIASLEMHPQRYPRVHQDELAPHEVRQLLYGKRRGIYRILFLIRAETVSVISVRHSARQPIPLHQLLDEVQDAETPPE